MSEVIGKRVLLWGEPGCELEVLADSLGRWGMQVREGLSAGELYAAARSGEADLIVARLCRGFHPSFELLTRLRGLAAALPVVVVTDDVPLYLEALRRGAFDCVALPLNEAELMRIVSRALESKRQDYFAAGGRK